jgi:hypothetical protein
MPKFVIERQYLAGLIHDAADLRPRISAKSLIPIVI